LESNIAIRVENVSKGFDSENTNKTIFGKLTRSHQNSEKLQVLTDISFSVKKGELLGIIGKNGIGKTTLLRLISGIYKPDSGNISVNGKMSLFLELGTGFQLELTAKENIELVGMILGFKKAEIIKKIPKIMEFSELEKFLNTKLKHFSSGMFARLSFSTAIQMDYDIFLIDEILSVGDQEFQKKSFDTFMNLKKQGKTFVVVSHNHNMLQSISDRLLFIHNGKLLSIGDPATVVKDYNNV